MAGQRRPQPSPSIDLDTAYIDACREAEQKVRQWWCNGGDLGCEVIDCSRRGISKEEFDKISTQLYRDLLCVCTWEVTEKLFDEGVKRELADIRDQLRYEQRVEFFESIKRVVHEMRDELIGRGYPLPKIELALAA